MPTITHSILHTIAAADDFLPLDSLRFGGVHYLTGQTDLYQDDENAWAYDDGGHWIGPAPLATVPVNLRVDGATPEVWNYNNFDVIHRAVRGSGVPAGEMELTLKWDIPYYATIGSSTAGWRYVLQSLADGSVVQSGTVQAGAVTLSGVADGNYLALVRLDTFEPPFLLPDGYVRSSQYQYGASYSDYWDYTYNVGKLPPAGHAFYALRAALVANNQQQDRSDWTWYLINDSERGGEWSARFVAVDESTFSVESTFIPDSGASLYSITGTTTRAALAVDPLARTGNVLKERSTGTLLLAGQRMTPSGVVTALWEGIPLDPPLEGGNLEWTLLGTNQNVSTGVCECALENHGPTDILEKSDGTLLVLTKCALLKYNADGATIDARLEGFPKGASAPYVSPSGETIEDGFPGGASLREYKDDLYHTTENFNQTSFTDLNGDTRAQFYDVLQITKGVHRFTGPGTRFHGNNDIESWLGKLWGVMQTGGDTASNSLQYIANFNGTDWSQESKLVFAPAIFQWQRLAATPGCGANVLMVFGKKADDETGFMGFADGEMFAQQGFNYRVRRLTLSPNSTGGDAGATGSKVLLAVARASTSSAIDTTQWHIVEIVISGDSTGTQPTVKEPGTGGDEPCEGGVAAVVVRVVPEDGKPIYAIECTSVEPDRRIENYNINNAGIWARSDSTESASDASSFTFQVPYGRRYILPTPAHNYVDVLFFVPYGCEGLDVGPKVLVRN